VSFTLETMRGRLLAGRYELGEVIGAGGAARVYRAADRHLDRDVAVKVLDDAAAKSAGPSARRRFLQEARTAAGLDHPNVVTVFDAGADGGALFLVMELVSGCTLAEHIARHAPLPVDDAVDIVRQIAGALAAAHARGIVHRDVKPANVLLDRSGRALLTDFGIAKHLDEIESAITSAGMVVGTPAYLAPEQAMGHDLTPACDVYALGVVLHEMLTGWHPPRDASSAWRMAPFDPRVRRPDVPEPLAAAVVHATQLDPEARFGSAGALLAALDGAEPVVAPRPAAAPAPEIDPTATMAITPAERPTEVLAQVSGESAAALATGTRPAVHIGWPVLAVLALVVAVLIVSAERSVGGIELPTTTVATVPPTTAPHVPSTTVAPAPTAPAAPAPAPDEGGNGNGNGDDNGNGNSRGKGNGNDDDD
jgi:serine/threonine protein kinase